MFFKFPIAAITSELVLFTNWIKQFPRTLTIPEGTLLVYGAPENDISYFLAGGVREARPREVLHRAGETAANLILCGHSHTPRIYELSNHCLIVNPGSVYMMAFTTESHFRTKWRPDAAGHDPPKKSDPAAAIAQFFFMYSHSIVIADMSSGEEFSSTSASTMTSLCLSSRPFPRQSCSIFRRKSKLHPAA